MVRSTLCYSFLLVVFFVWCGCNHDRYEIEIKPDGEAFQRRLTCWRVVGENDDKIISLRADQLASLAKFYPQRETQPGEKKQVFSGRFIGKTPGDIGGAGAYTCYVTPLGNASAYVERFRGNDDLAGRLDKELAKRRQAADQLADLLTGWMTTELGQEPNFPKLKKFLENDLRRDLRNLATYTLTFQLASDSRESSHTEMLVRLAQYFCERGYFSPQEIPTLARSIYDEDPKPLLVHFQRFLARKLGIADDQPLPESLEFLDSFERLDASCAKYVRSTKQFRNHQEGAKSKKNDKNQLVDSPENEKANIGSEPMFDLATDLVGFELNLFDTSDYLLVKLFSGEKPYATNGEWDEKTATVSWHYGVSNKDRDELLPAVCFALWSTPDGAFQKSHFGKTLLAGSSLAEYAIWYRALKPAEAKEWDRFINGLKPGPELAASVEAFRFSTDTKAVPNKSEQPADLAATPRRLILDALESEPNGTE